MKSKYIYMGIIFLLLVGSVTAWSYIKQNGIFVVTLDSGTKVNVSDIVYDRQAKTITATVNVPELSIQDAVELNNISQGIQNTLDKKNNAYTLSTIVINN